MNYENKFDYTVVKAEHDGLLCKSRGIAFIDFTLSTPMINVNTVPMNNWNIPDHTKRKPKQTLTVLLLETNVYVTLRTINLFDIKPEMICPKEK